jgi:two-component system, chemotaxis family, chemotaxis protein CheY
MSPDPGNPASRPLESRKVLVVDDAESIRSVLKTALSDAGADTWLAEDGMAALKMLSSAVPDLILLDLVMPHLDGWGVIEELRRSARTAKIPVILETSVEDYVSFERARRDGVAAFLSKPFRLNEVIETCRRVFEGARPLQGSGNAASPARTVGLRTPEGTPLAMAALIDVDAEGAQIELTAPLPLGTVVLLGPIEPGQQPIRAEVRWVTCAGERCLVGLQSRPAR